MKLIAVAALAVSLVGAAPLSDSIDSMLELTTEQVEKFEVKGLGGMTLRAEQIYNENFYTAGRGPRAYLQSLRKYSQLGATIDPSLLCLVQSILQELGLGGAGAGGASCPSTTGGGGTGTGTGTGTSTGTGSGKGDKPSTTGAAARPTASGRPGTGGGSNSTGPGQGRCC